MSSTLELLAQAAEIGAVVNIVYNGGSNPGSTRPVIPISVTATELIARDPTLRVAKTFKLVKIASVTSGTVTAENVDAPPVVGPSTPIFATLQEYVDHLKLVYIAQGWHVVEDHQYLGVCGHFKSGKPRKTPVVSVQFVDRSIQTAVDISTGDLVTVVNELTGRERPWRVESKLQSQAKAFSDLRKAMEFFATEISACDPNR